MDKEIDMFDTDKDNGKVDLENEIQNLNEVSKEEDLVTLLKKAAAKKKEEEEKKAEADFKPKDQNYFRSLLHGAQEEIEEQQVTDIEQRKINMSDKELNAKIAA